MSYVRVESSVRTNRKFLQAGPAPSWLWLCGLAYCQEGLTDGFIPAEAIGYLGVKNARRLAAHLVRARLWDVVEHGWQVHDYLQHNKSAATVAAVKEERRSAGAKGGEASGEARRKQVASALSKQSSNPSTSTSTATATATATTRPATLIARRNPNAAYEGPRNLYVLQGQHAKFLGLLNGQLTETELFGWYEDVATSWAVGVNKSKNTGGDMPKFWDARFEERWPPEPKDRRPAWQREVV